MFSCAFQAEPSLTLKLLQTKGKTQGTYVRHKGFLNQYKSAPPARAITRSPVHSIHTQRVTTRLLSRCSQKQDKGLCVTPVSALQVCIHPTQTHCGGFAMWEKTEHIINRNLRTTPASWACNTSCSKSKQKIKQKNKRLGMKLDEMPVRFSISLKP